MTRAGKKPTATGIKRRRAIMDAALRLFLERGFEAISVDEIVKASKGSKSSVYEYFGSKQGLLKEIVSSISDDIIREYRSPEDLKGGPAVALTHIGLTICDRILTKEGIGLFRLAVSTAQSMPGLARTFYESGPLMTQKKLENYLKKEAHEGRLKIKDPKTAMRFFLGMLLVHHHIAMPLGCAKEPSKAEKEHIVRNAVEVFLAAYGNGQ